MDTIDTKVYSQWIIVEIKNLFKEDISINSSKVDYGKFHKLGDKDTELDPSEINKIVIKPGQIGYVCACGRANIHYGTEGSFQLFDGATKICKIYFDVPYHRPTNKFQILDKNSGYAIDVGPWNQEGGALGNVRVEVLKK